MKKKAIEYLVMVLLLSPLLFINIRSSHDWGDDFAGYITEAKNIAEGRPFYESKMLPQDYMPSYAPQYYSYGFPLLIAPIIKVFGIKFKILDLYISIWCVLWALTIFYYLRSRFSFFSSAAFVFIFFINPFFFKFKTEIISDIPFSFFFTLSMLFFIARRELSFLYRVLFGVIVGFTIGIRDLGFFFPMLIVCDMLLETFRLSLRRLSRAEFITNIKSSLTTLATCAVFMFVVGGIIFKSPHSQLLHFLTLYESPSYWQTFVYNLDVYTNLFENLFRHDVGRYGFTLYYSTAFMLVLTVLGFIHLLFSAYKWELLLFIGYGVVVLLFPFSSQGFRYLLPVLPIIMLCAIYGARSITLPVPLSKYAAGAFFLLLMAFVNFRDIRSSIGEKVVARGPMTEDNKVMLDYVKTNIPKDALIATIKPRALALFTDRHTCLVPKNATVPFISNRMKEARPDYLLHIDDLQTNLVNELAEHDHDSLIWEHAGNRLYKCSK
jgi:hypothetical protein